MVDRRGIEPRLKACKAPVLPLSLPAQNLVASGGLEPPTRTLSRCCSTPELTGQTWRCQGVTISFFERDRLACVHEHFGTLDEASALFAMLNGMAGRTYRLCT